MLWNHANLNPHLTQDGDGYVYWKGAHVEHYSFRDEFEREAEAARELAQRCEHLESLGIEVRTGTAIWWYSWLADLTPETLAELPELARDIFTHPRNLNEDAQGRIAWIAGETEVSGDEWKRIARVVVFDRGVMSDVFVQSDDLGGFYHPMKALGWEWAQMGQSKDNGCCYATTAQVLAWMRAKGVL